MDLRESLDVAFSAIIANKLRSFLTMLGIIIGVGALITVVAVGKGGERAVAERLQALGTNLLYVSPGSSRSGPVMASAGSSVKLTRKDLEAVLANCEEIEAVVPEFSRSSQVKYGNRNWNSRITGTTPNYGEVRNVKAVAGRYFTALEEAARARVCLIGSTVRDNLFDPEEDPLGKTLRIGRMNFEIIGVLETKGQAGGWMNPDDQVLIPLATAQMRLFGVDHLTNSTLKVADASLMDKAFYDVERVLRKQHRLRDTQDNDFHIRNQADIISTFESTQKNHHHDAHHRGDCVTIGGRYRHYEHYAGIGYRAHARDWHPQGHRRKTPEHHDAIPAGSTGALDHRRPARHRHGRGPFPAGRASHGLANADFPVVGPGERDLRGGSGHHLRPLSGLARRAPGNHRSPALRVKRCRPHRPRGHRSPRGMQLFSAVRE